MANSKQSEKRARQNTARRLRGQAVRSRCRTMIKKARIAAAGDDAEKFRAAFIAMQSAADRAADKNLMHRNTVARIKSRINRIAKANAAAMAAAMPQNPSQPEAAATEESAATTQPAAESRAEV